MYIEPKMENTCEEKNIFPPKMSSENVENMGFTYKSKILKFKIQPKE